MRAIERSSAFKRDYKRVKATSQHRYDVDGILLTAVALLAGDQVLPESLRDHALSGVWSSYRECHLKPDLLLIYRKADTNTLRLARLGSHSELFG